MSKKQYEAAAKIVQEVAFAHGTAPAFVAQSAFLALFRSDGNDRFDPVRFTAACVPGANVRARG